MKTLIDYCDKHYTKAFEDFGAFFAFGDEQFEEARVEGTEYKSIGAGLYCPKVSAVTLQIVMAEIHKDGIRMDIKENGLLGIIRRELFNHEAFYTGEIEDTYDSLRAYDINRDHIQEVYNTISTNESCIGRI